MKTSHTPGPWLRENNTVYSLMHYGWRKGTELFKNRFHTYVQADKECPDDEHEANVLLIAAAPELLEALESALDALENEGVTFWSDTQDKARDAIAKATGGK